MGNSSCPTMMTMTTIEEAGRPAGPVVEGKGPSYWSHSSANYEVVQLVEVILHERLGCAGGASLLNLSHFNLPLAYHMPSLFSNQPWLKRHSIQFVNPIMYPTSNRKTTCEWCDARPHPSC